MSEKHEYICLLGIDPKKVQKCNASECPTCGWEAAEAERRRAYLREHGLTLCADGLRRLIIPKNGGNEEMKYKVCDHCGAHLDNGETCDCRNTNNDGGEPKDKQKERKTIMTGINEVAKQIHENAVDHGWWDEERGFPEVLALIHSEVSEALEEYRNGRLPTEVYTGNNGKPEGIPIELADVIIRVLDYCGYTGIDIDAAISQKHEYNRTRPYRHGGKKC